MPGWFTNGMDLWGDDAAFYRITSISCFTCLDSHHCLGQHVAIGPGFIHCGPLKGANLFLLVILSEIN